MRIRTLSKLFGFVQFDFAGKVLAAQRDFAEKLVRASAPAIKTTPVDVPTPVVPKKA